MEAVEAMNLAGFLLARIAEDEEAAQDVHLAHVIDMGGERLDERHAHLRVRYASSDGRSRFDYEKEDVEHFDRWAPARVIAECKAKRRIVQQYLDSRDAEFPDFDGGYASASEDAVYLLALPYADHPDYAWHEQMQATPRKGDQT
jgi:hypothetical protein